MLKSTYKSDTAPPALPPGWTEHKAPSGHSYFYNASTQQSTYTRPAAEPAAPTPARDTTTPLLPPKPDFPNLFPDFNAGPQTSLPFQQQSGPTGSGDFRGGRGYQDRRSRQPEDRPRSKHAIPNCEPWLLVKTKLGRRFVYDPEANESFWKFPEHVLKGVVEYDRREREKKERRERGEASEDEVVPVDAKKEKNEEKPTGPALGQYRQEEEDSDEYEEVEVTDDEGDEGASVAKKARMDQEAEDADQPVEFNEDDIAYQLAQMGQDHGDEYDDGEEGPWEDGDEGPTLTEDDSEALFHDLLDDFRINPYRTWEQIIDDGRIIDDPRYVALPTTKARKESYSKWGKLKIQRLREQREKEEKRDPKIRYVAFLQIHATPKLYWPEFRRKFKKEPEMKDTNLADKEKEKMYRDHINRLKLPESTRKSDLSVMLKAAPLTSLNAGSTVDTLPTSIITDLRYISLAAQVRDPLIETYISTLPPAPEQASLSAEDSEEAMKAKSERERREKALADRERRVQEEKRKQHGALRQGRELLGNQEAELQRAMRVERGKEGLKGYMDVDESEEQNGD